jgi:hypothetical protein
MKIRFCEIRSKSTGKMIAMIKQLSIMPWWGLGSGYIDQAVKATEE